MTYYLICDESRQVKERYMLIGGILIDKKTYDDLNLLLKKYRSKHKMFKEHKWTKVSKNKIEAYKEFIDCFLDKLTNFSEKLFFHTLIVDKHKFDHKKFSQGDPEKTFYKMYYQLILNSFTRCLIKSDSKPYFQLYLDHRNTHYKLDKLKEVLNNGANKYYRLDYCPFSTIEAIDSNKCDLLQIVDIIIGAIGYDKHGLHKVENASPGKCDLLKHIQQKTNHFPLSKSTPYSRKKFKVWNFQFKKRNFEF